MLQQLKSLDSLNSFGKIQYSNYGIGLLGMAMESAANKPFQELFNLYINSELNLKNTFYKVSEKQLVQIAIPHLGFEEMPLIQLYNLSPAGSVKATLPDVLSFLKFHLDTKRNGTLINGLISDQLKGQAETVGFGWGIFEREGVKLNFHIGGTYGSSSIVIIAPEKQVGVVLLTNNQIEGGLTSYALKIFDNLIH